MVPSSRYLPFNRVRQAAVRGRLVSKNLGKTKWVGIPRRIKIQRQRVAGPHRLRRGGQKQDQNNPQLMLLTARG